VWDTRLEQSALEYLLVPTFKDNNSMLSAVQCLQTIVS
jgi:hypothetical protein